MKRPLAWLLAAACIANGLAMLLDGAWWYAAVPGVIQTGPYNPHFIMDIGVAYLAAGLGYAWFGAGRGVGAAVGGTLFLGFHALIHSYNEICGHNPLGEFARDFAGVFLIPLIGLWVVWPAAKKGA
jgi:hypothetical protein